MAEPITDKIPVGQLIGGSDDGRTVDPGEEKQTLKFHFTPREALAGEMERLRNENPHAQATTFLPDLASDLKARFGDAIGETTLYAGETTVYVSRDGIVPVCEYLFSVGFTYMADMLSIDRFTETDRFEIGYNLVAMKERRRLRLKVRVDEEDAVVPSVVHVWPGARLARARGVGHDGRPLRRQPGPPAHLHARGLRVPPAAQGIPDARHPGLAPAPAERVRRPAHDGPVRPRPRRPPGRLRVEGFEG